MESLEFDGIEELQEALLDVAKKYPNLAEKTMKKERRDFIKNMKDETWKKVDQHTGNLVKGYRFGPINAARGNLESDFYAEGGKKNPHFHLVNNGHELVTPVSRRGKKLEHGGREIGFVPGRRIKEPIIEKWKQEHAVRAERMLNKICEEANK